jgi:hypothetical protein
MVGVNLKHLAPTRCVRQRDWDEAIELDRYDLVPVKEAAE